LAQKWPKKAPKHPKKLKSRKKPKCTIVADMFLHRLKIVAGLRCFRDFQGFAFSGKIVNFGEFT
jgi:hypothetical protein